MSVYTALKMKLLNMPTEKNEAKTANAAKLIFGLLVIGIAILLSVESIFTRLIKVLNNRLNFVNMNTGKCF